MRVLGLASSHFQWEIQMENGNGNGNGKSGFRGSSKTTSDWSKVDLKVWSASVGR